MFAACLGNHIRVARVRIVYDFTHVNFETSYLISNLLFSIFLRQVLIGKTRRSSRVGLENESYNTMTLIEKIANKSSRHLILSVLNRRFRNVGHKV